MMFIVMTSCFVIQIHFKFLKINFLIAVTHECMYTHLTKHYLRPNKIRKINDRVAIPYRYRAVICVE